MAGENGWTRCKIGDVFTLTPGFAFKSRDFAESGTPVVKIKNVKAGEVVLDTLSYVDPKFVEERSNYLIRRGDILITLSGNRFDGSKETWVGKVAEFKRDGHFLLNQRVAILRPKPDASIDTRCCAYLMGADEYQHLFIAIATSSGGQANLSSAQVLGAELRLPSLSEQKAIAEILGGLDAKIELNRRMNETLESLARAMFKSWFVDFDPVRAKLDGRQPPNLPPAPAALFPDSFEQSEIGPIPRGWSTTELGQLASADKGLSYKGKFLSDDDGRPMVNLGCFAGNGRFQHEKLKRYTGDHKPRHLVKSGDVVIANTDMTQKRVVLGSPAFVPRRFGDDELLFTHHVFALRFGPDADKWKRYVYFALLRPEFREIAEGFATGTTVLALPKDGLLKYTLCLPPEEVRDAFETQVGPILNRIEQSFTESETLAALRDTLLPRLLSGELRVAASGSLTDGVAV